MVGGAVAAVLFLTNLFHLFRCEKFRCKETLFETRGSIEQRQRLQRPEDDGKRKSRQEEIEKLRLKLLDEYSQQKPPDYDAILDVYAAGLDIDALEEIEFWVGMDQEQLESKRRELEAEERRLQAWDKRLTKQSQGIEDDRRELKNLRAELRKYRQRWDEARRDLDTELREEFVSFAVGDHPEGAFIAPDPAESFYEEALTQTIDLLLGQLNDEYRQPLELRFGFVNGGPRSYVEIGRLCGVSSATAAQRVKKGLRQMRHPLRSRLLRDYLFSDKQE